MAKRIENRGPGSIDAFGWTVQKGYVYRVVAADDSAWDCSKEIKCEDGSVYYDSCRFGYHGADLPPCGADYLYGEDDGSELLVISSEDDPENIDTVDGFRLEPVTLEPGEHYHDGTWQFYVLDVDRDGETTLAGKC